MKNVKNVLLVKEVEHHTGPMVYMVPVYYVKHLINCSKFYGECIYAQWTRMRIEKVFDILLFGFYYSDYSDFIIRIIKKILLKFEHF
jgi:hypothetical protein